MKLPDQVWAALDIEPTADTSTIRRAYARRLKRLDQDKEREAFAILRGAYESALRAAEGSAQAAQSAGEPAATAAPIPTPALPPMSDAGQAIRAALTARDAGDAARLLSEARRACSLPLAEDMVLAAQLLNFLSHDRKLGGRTLREAAQLMGWQNGGANYRRSSDMERLSRRIDAEIWYESIVESAKACRYCLTGPGRAAKLLLGRGRAPIAAALLPGFALARAVAGFAVHGGWLSDRFDPARIAHLRALLASRYSTQARRHLPRLRKFTARYGRLIYLALWLLFMFRHQIWP